MFGAGKRKTRPPARYRDDEWEVPYQPQDVSTPRDRLRLAVQKEWRDVTREVERLQADIADMNLEGEDADNASATPLPLPRRGVVERDSRTISRDLDRHLGLAQKRQQTATRDPNRPSLNEIRALNRLAGIDPVLDYMGEDFAQQTAPTLRQSAQLPTQEQFEQAPVTEDDPGKGKRKLLSGLSRKVHDKVVKEVYWPHEFVFNSLTPVTADNITWDQLISGELAIIFSPKISVIERHNRSLILRNLLLDVQVYTFPGIRSFYRTMLLHAERALFDLESTQVLTHLARLKEEYLRRPAVSTATTANKSTTSSTKGQSQASSLQFNPCFKFNAGTCSEENDHQGDGTAHAQTTTQAYALPHIIPAVTVQYTNGLELSTDAAAHSQASTTAISSQRTPTSPMDRQNCGRPSLTANTAASVPTTQFTYPDKITYANQGSSVSHTGEDTVLTRTDSPTLLQRFSFKTGSAGRGRATAIANPSKRTTISPRDRPESPGTSQHPQAEASQGLSSTSVFRNVSSTLPRVQPPLAPTLTYTALHDTVYKSGQYNFRGLRLAVPSRLNIPAWREALATYHDSALCDFLEFGWPLGYTSTSPLRPSKRNHNSALVYDSAVDDYIRTEVRLGATHGPFDRPPFEHSSVMTSPLQTVSKRGSNRRRVVLDLSFPPGASVNDGIPAKQYLGEDFILTLPSYDAFETLIRDKGPGCYMFKRDLRRAYRQIPVDPHDYYLLGYRWRDKLYYDSSFPFGLRTAAMACQRTTNAVTYIHAQQDHHCTNYIDDFGGVATPDAAQLAYSALGDTFQRLGLEESADKATPPSTCMTFLGVEYNSATMTKQVPQDRLAEALNELAAWETKKKATGTEVQSLLGKLSFITACVAPGRVFLSRIISTLKGLRSAHHRIRLNRSFKQDIHWWHHFLPEYNGVSLIPDPARRHLAAPPTTDACLTGCGGTFSTEYFHTRFPTAILQANHPIHRLEMVAIIVACKIWGNAWAGCTVNIACDNLPTVHVIHSGRSQDHFMQACARELVYLQAVKDFSLHAHHIPALAWKLLERDTLQTQRQAFAVGTQANHRTQFRAYLAFCHYFNKPAFPATAHLLSCYAQFLGRSLKCPDSISHYLSSVKLLHQLNGVYSLDLQAFEIKQTLRGLKKTLQHRPRESRPVTPELLNRLHRHIDPANSKDATIWAILLLGFFAYFRKSNLVPSSTKAFDPHKHLRRRDIAVATEGLVLRTSWSKTVQANEREVLAPILAIPGSNLCPVSAYKNMLQLVPATPDSPAFLLPPSTNRPARPVTASILEKSFKRLLSQAGLPPGSYTIHDLRRGGYTLAFEAGVPRELRQQHGDWRSNADLLYLKLSMAQRLRLPAAMRRLLLLRTT
ncbi:cytoplasmic pattern recognition receptor signaling pathway in response to virus [Branchiostoma belcheri]|nr:cytoplasmic pattern recognition receptor signaling pathway in response to virus [Branchiostoma belcheri]